MTIFKSPSVEETDIMNSIQNKQKVVVFNTPLIYVLVVGVYYSEKKYSVAQ